MPYHDFTNTPLLRDGAAEIFSSPPTPGSECGLLHITHTQAIGGHRCPVFQAGFDTACHRSQEDVTAPQPRKQGFEFLVSTSSWYMWPRVRKTLAPVLEAPPAPEFVSLYSLRSQIPALGYRLPQAHI